MFEGSFTQQPNCVAIKLTIGEKPVILTNCHLVCLMLGNNKGAGSGRIFHSDGYSCGEPSEEVLHLAQELQKKNCLMLGTPVVGPTNEDLPYFEDDLCSAGQHCCILGRTLERTLTETHRVEKRAMGEPTVPSHIL